MEVQESIILYYPLRDYDILYYGVLPFSEIIILVIFAICLGVISANNAKFLIIVCYKVNWITRKSLVAALAFLSLE